MNSIKTFLAKYHISFHAMALVTIFVVGAFNSIPKFHDDVMTLYNLMPAAVKDIVVDAILLIGFYKTWQKAQPPVEDGTAQATRLKEVTEKDKVAQ